MTKLLWVAGFAIFLAASAASSIGEEEILKDKRVKWAEDAQLSDEAPDDLARDVDLALRTEVKGFNFFLGGAVCYVLRQNFGLKKICTGNEKYLGINVGNRWQCNKLDGENKAKLKVIAGNRVLWECAKNCGSFSKKNGRQWSGWQGVHSGREGVWARTMDKFKPKFSAVDSKGEAIAKFSGGFVRAGQSACRGDYADRCAWEKNGKPRTQYTFNCLYKALECCVGNGGSGNRCGKTFSDCMGNKEAAALQLLQVQSNQTNDLDGLLDENLDDLLEEQTSTTDHAGATAGWNCG
jgi:hypothetical protein